MKRTILLIAIATATACTAPTPETRPTPPAEAAVPAINLSQRCTNTQHGFSVSYPAGWQTNDGSVLPACSAFDPRPISMPRDSELPFEIAIVLDVEKVAVDELTRSTQWERVLSSEQTTIGGRKAFRVEVEATGEGLADRGMRSLRYVIDLGGGRTLIGATHGVNPSYEGNKNVLARMVESVTLN
ncbi:MAG TPA: hypothetical protein VGF48_23965 [Thermoanaerobaculia bacterium]